MSYLSADIIYVNSANRNSGTASDFIYDVSQYLRVPNRYNRCTLLKFACSKSYYLITSANNSFIVNENGVLHTITIPTANYTFSSLTTTLSALFVASCSYTYAINDNSDTGRFEFTVSGNGAVQPIFDFTTSASPFEIMGFDYDTYTFVANYLESANIINFQKTEAIELCTDFVDRNVLSIIIPTNTIDFGTIDYDEKNPQFASRKLSNNNFTAGRFYLIDGNTGLPMNMNGINCRFVFVMYEENNYYAHMLEDKKLELTMQSLREEIDKIK